MLQVYSIQRYLHNVQMQDVQPRYIDKEKITMQMSRFKFWTTYPASSQVQWLICMHDLQFLRAVELAMPHWYANSSRKEDEFQPDEERLTDDMSR